MINYKVVVHRNKIGTNPIFVQKNVNNKQLSQIIYALTTDYPGCSISLYPEQTVVTSKAKSISSQLARLFADELDSRKTLC